MTDVFRKKYLTCFEWKFRVKETCSSSTCIMVLKSESFCFQNRKCNLKFVSKPYISYLYFECDNVFSNSVEVFVDVHVTSASIKDFKRSAIGCLKQEIWNFPLNLQNYLMTFKVILGTPTVQGEVAEDYFVCGLSRVAETPYLGHDTHFQALSRDFTRLLEKDKNFDVRIICAEKTFQAHKIILRARSSVFSAMLDSKMEEGKTGLIKLKNIDSYIFESFLKYLYSGILPELNMITAMELFKAADQYDVTELMKACSEFMLEKLSARNAYEVLLLADLHSEKEFRTKVISYFIQKKIPQNDSSWSDFCKQHSLLATEVLNLYIKKYLS